MDFPTMVVIKSIAIYFFIVIAIRLFGKKELSQLSIIDLVFILLISNSVQNAMVEKSWSFKPDSDFVAGLVAAASLFAVNYLLKLLLFKSKGVSKFLQGNPVLLIHKGKVLQENLLKERITISELEQSAREHGATSLSEVDLAVLEVDGNISILSNSYTRQTKRKRKIHKSLL
jgi:uncharacterized membrane protein YcaP (DUF421 family)